MNYGRLALAGVVATVVDAVYGFIVYGRVLAGQFARYPGVFRPDDAQTAYLPSMFLGILIAMLVVTYIYAKGYEGGSGIAEGVRFGILIGLFNIGYVVAVNYATLNVGRRLPAYMAIAGLVEWILVGAAIGAIYKPGGTARAQRAAGV